MQVCTIVRGKTLKTMYRSKDAEAAEMALEDFAANPWGQKYPAIAQSCRRNWEREIPFPFRRLSGGPSTPRTPLRRSTQNYDAPCAHEVIFQTNSRRPSICFSYLFLVLRQAAGEWKMSPSERFEAKTQFAIMFDERLVQA